MIEILIVGLCLGSLIGLLILITLRRSVKGTRKLNNVLDLYKKDWHDVSVPIPDDIEKVIACDEKLQVNATWASNLSYRKNGDIEVLGRKMIAWMPMPLPYKKGKK